MCISSSFGWETFKHQRTTCHRTKVKANTECTGAEYRMHNEKPATHIGVTSMNFDFSLYYYTVCVRMLMLKMKQ